MQKELLKWYRQNKRELPWRVSRDAYRIWISEVMLQQTTVAAVIPYYEKFMKRFPSVQKLAAAPLEDVLEYWAGLGYYSRARNLHKAAQVMAAEGIPQKASQLIKLPGFGPYTSNAVASLAFNEKVGVLDGNVIRVLSRVYGLKTDWWLPAGRRVLQKRSDELAQSDFNSEINQGLMELGATVCTPKKPLCLLCPWKTQCVALAQDRVEQLPGPKPKAQFETWIWKIHVKTQGQQIYLVPNTSTPFLTSMLFPEGEAKKVKAKPKNFDLKHGVTKYDIYIQLQHEKVKNSTKSNWYALPTIKKVNPTSLMTKILKKLELDL